MSVGSYRLKYGRKIFQIKKKGGSLMWRFWRGYCYRQNHRQIQNDSPYGDVIGSPFKMPTESPRDSKCQIRTVTCCFFHQNHRRHHRRKSHRWNRRKKLIYVLSADPLLPYFSFFFLIPTLPICKQPPPPPLPPKTKISLISAQQVIFLEVLWSQHPYSDLPTDFINFCK